MRLGPDRDRGGTPGASANERFKSRWTTWVGASTLSAFAAHLILIGVVSWEILHPGATASGFDGDGLALLPPPADGSGLGSDPVPARPVDVDEDAVEPPQAEPQEGEGARPDMDDAWEALRRRIGDRMAPLPALARRESERALPVPGTERVVVAQVPRSIEVRASTADLADASDSTALALDRLAALRPELAVAAPSAWVLIRNPLEVEDFLRRSFRWGRLDPTAEGSVNVTLWIDARGSVAWAEISKSSGREDLDELALALFNEVADFRPAREEGVSVSRSVTFALNFPW